MSLRPTEQLDRLRRYRATRPTTPTLAAEIQRQTTDLSKRHRSLSGLGEFWAEVVPAELARTVEVHTLRRSVLTVRARDSSAAYAFDRWLRAGGLAALQGRSPASLARVKIVT